MPRLLQPHRRIWIGAATVAASGDVVGKVVAPVKVVANGVVAEAAVVADKVRDSEMVKGNAMVSPGAGHGRRVLRRARISAPCISPAIT